MQPLNPDAVKVKNNPKIDGSGIIDCIPQTGQCPRGCDQCFYNNGFFRTLDEPLLVSIEQSKGRIVRMNSGHDSGFEKEKVLEQAALYDDVFFSTAGTDLDFPGPVVLTVNPAASKTFQRVDPIPSNLMFVRFRACLWNLVECGEVCQYYSERKVPVIITWMRYFDRKFIPQANRDRYVFRKSILNSYWALPKNEEDNLTRNLQQGFPRVYYCGNRWSSLCASCGNCLREYFSTKERIGKRDNA